MLTVTKNSLRPCLTAVREDVSTERREAATERLSVLCPLHPRRRKHLGKGDRKFARSKGGWAGEESCLVTTEPAAALPKPLLWLPALNLST